MMIESKGKRFTTKSPSSPSGTKERHFYLFVFLVKLGALGDLVVRSFLLIDYATSEQRQ